MLIHNIMIIRRESNVLDIREGSCRGVGISQHRYNEPSLTFIREGSPQILKHVLDWKSCLTNKHVANTAEYVYEE